MTDFVSFYRVCPFVPAFYKMAGVPVTVMNDATELIFVRDISDLQALCHYLQQLLRQK